MGTNRLARFPTGHEVVGVYLAPEASIPGYLTLYGYRFTRSAGLRVEAFIRHYLRWFVDRCFQSIGRIEMDLYENQFTFRRHGNLRITHCGVFKD